MSRALSPIEQLIANWINAQAEHDRLFALNDWHLASQDAVWAALDPLGDALIAICAARPTDADEKALRQQYLDANLAEAIDGCDGLTELVLAALRDGDAGCAS